MYTNMKFYSEFDSYFDILVDATRVFKELQLDIKFGFYFKNNFIDGYLSKPESEIFIDVSSIFYSLEEFSVSNGISYDYARELYFKEVSNFINKYNPQFFF